MSIFQKSPGLFVIRGSRRHGLTLIEVMAVMGVALLLFGLVIRIFFLSQDAVGHSVDKIEAVQNARQAVDRLTPIVNVACDSNALSEAAVRIGPPEAINDISMQVPIWLDIKTTEELVAVPLHPRDQFVPFHQVPSLRYRVEFVPDEGLLVLKKMDPTGEIEDTSVAPKLLAGGLMGLQFRPVLNDQRLIEVRVRVAQDTTIRPVGDVHVVESSAVLHIPAESLK